MAKVKELSYTQLKKECNPNVFSFKTTKEVEPYKGIIGQERGIKALEFGVNIDVKGYNIYIEGSSGIGKTRYAKQYLKKIATSKLTPDDWMYLYNFENTNEPIAVSLPAGQGKKFKDEMEAFTNTVKSEK